MTRRTVPGCFVVAICVLLTQELPGQTKPPRAEIASRAEALIARFMTDDGPPGVSVAIVRDGDTLVSGGWGLADREHTLAATAGTSYRVGSMASSFAWISCCRDP